MKRRIFIGVSILIVWILLVNIANSYEHLNWIYDNVIPTDVAYPVEDYPIVLGDYILNYIEITFLFFKEEHLLINIIYLAMIYTLFSQLYIFILNKKDKKEAIEFNLNIPPLLGVIGTIYAFASFIAQESSVQDIMIILKSNFNSAAMTTILGGITYTMNYIILVIDEKLTKVE